MPRRTNLEVKWNHGVLTIFLLIFYPIHQCYCITKRWSIFSSTWNIYFKWHWKWIFLFFAPKFFPWCLIIQWVIPYCPHCHCRKHINQLGDSHVLSPEHRSYFKGASMSPSTLQISRLCLHSTIPAPSNGNFQGGFFSISLIQATVVRRWTQQRFYTLLALQMHSTGFLRDHFSFSIQAWALVCMNKISCHGDHSISTESTYKMKTKHWLYSRQILQTLYALTHLVKTLKWMFSIFYLIFQSKGVM